MSSQEFDNLLRQKVENGELEYNPALWQHMHTILHNNDFDAKLIQSINSNDLEYHPEHWQKILALLNPDSFNALLQRKIDSEEISYHPEHWHQLSAALSSSHFDAALQERMDVEELPYQKVHWQQLSEKLSPTTIVSFKKRRILPWAIGVAACLLIALATVLLFDNANNTTIPVVVKDMPQQPVESASPQGNNNIATAPIINADSNAIHHQSNKTLPPQNTIHTPAIPYETIVNNSITHPFSIPQPHTNTPTPSTHPDEEIIVKGNNNQIVEKEEVYPNRYIPPMHIAFAHDEPRTSLGVGGGVNYGNFKTGITFGVSARQYISKNVFIDGTVAMNVSQGGSDMLRSSRADAMSLDAKAKGTRARPATANATNIYKAKDFYYIQMNPTIGYKVSKKVALAAGPDLQQAMTDGSDETFLLQDGMRKQIPDLDMGVTGKAEFSITPNIQSGLVYREGVNSLILGKDYYNRRYVQVQIKYTIPLNN